MLLNRVIKSNFNRQLFINFSSLAEEKIQLDSFRTQNNHPNEQNPNNIGLFYTIPQDIKKNIYLHGGFPKSYGKQIKTFGESCLMIREPALEIINYIKNTDFKKPVNRYVIYGKNGVGKSLTLSHVLHYGFESEFLLVHVPWVANWFKRPKETGNSVFKEGYIDLPLDAAAWLIHFKGQNAALLAKQGLTVSKDLVWSKREKTPAGANLLELVEHGISRVKFASEVIEALINEIKLNSTAGKCKTLVAIDGFNAFFHPETRILADNKAKVSPDKVTLTQPFLEATKWDWKNGAVVVTVDAIAHTTGHMESELPRYLLGKTGFEHLDPFIPIRVNNYSEKEYLRCIEYYLNRKWIQTVKEGFQDELKFISDRNPFKLMELCKSL